MGGSVRLDNGHFIGRDYRMVVHNHFSGAEAEEAELAQSATDEAAPVQG